MEEHFSPKQVARAIGVSEASIKRWCDKGKIQTSKTAGGHRRLPKQAVLDFIRRDRVVLAKPELLGLPPLTQNTEISKVRLVAELESALVEGSRDRARMMIIQSYMSGHSVGELADQVIAPSFHRLGERWAVGDLQIFEERRACEMVLGILAEIESFLPNPEEGSPCAICATLSGDSYGVPLALLSATLKSGGCFVEKLGSNVPAADLSKALEKLRPRLFCLSFSQIEDLEKLQAELEILHQKAKSLDAMFILGGHALDQSIRKELSFDLYLEDLRQLTSFLLAMKTSRA